MPLPALVAFRARTCAIEVAAWWTRGHGHGHGHGGLLTLRVSRPDKRRSDPARRSRRGCT